MCSNRVHAQWSKDVEASWLYFLGRAFHQPEGLFMMEDLFSWNSMIRIFKIYMNRYSQNIWFFVINNKQLKEKFFSSYFIRPYSFLKMKITWTVGRSPQKDPPITGGSLYQYLTTDVYISINLWVCRMLIFYYNLCCLFFFSVKCRYL